MRRVLLALLVALPALALAGCVNVEEQPPAPEYPRHDLRFSGEDAYDHVVWQVTGPDGGPQYRVPGTPGHARVAQRIENEMAGLGYQTEFQSWRADYACEDTPLRNVVAWSRGATNRTIILGAHYDTRPVADKDPNPENRDDPVLGANDGGSGVAVLIELAESLRGRTPNLTVVYAFFDAEDGGDLPRDLYDCTTGWIMGSLQFVQRLDRRAGNRTEAVIVVDMVGDPDLKLPKEGYSADGPGAAVLDYTWRVGRALGYDEIFLNRAGPRIVDDHRAFLDPPAIERFGRPLPAIDIIHLDPDAADPFPPTHHTVEDDLDAVSAASLEAVGRTLEHVLLDADRAPIDA